MFTLIAEKDVVLMANHYLFSSQLRFGIIAGEVSPITNFNPSKEKL